MPAAVSSPIPAVLVKLGPLGGGRIADLRPYLDLVPDPRARRGRWYSLTAIGSERILWPRWNEFGGPRGLIGKCVFVRSGPRGGLAVGASLCSDSQGARMDGPRTKVELFAAIRRDARVEKLSIRELSRRYGVHRRLVREALTSPWPTARKPMPPRASVLDPYKHLIDSILRADLDAPRKQRHTAKRVFDRLVDEHGMEDVSYGRVRDYIRRRKPEIWVEEGRGPPAVFIPQTHRPGEEAEVDFGDVCITLNGVRTLCYLFVFRLSFSGRPSTASSSRRGRKPSSKATSTPLKCWEEYLVGKFATTT
ncbi:hypothetical protein GCM10010358_77900 [Streptomyces minutiscleroticus]|uniref:HTH IS21-type domain-containing protein n=2 Tax=Streptomyces minutiscleroticus TaxID=68238 RepID=A0A918P3A9_9ACTN|nr:hypothetical protein GCM10010358_77900 [Streptomyces minutiscleroticus]